MHVYNFFFTLKHLKSLQHVSILRSSSGSYTAKVTFLKTLAESAPGYVSHSQAHSQCGVRLTQYDMLPQH